LRLVAPPARFGRTPMTVRMAPPRHGEHTEQILQELRQSTGTDGAQL
jgi:crotonobetainyl-CoA:carnitine CoA-transferase CaiB-like acyl-CoA transferase